MANFMSISHRCYLFEVAFVWELTKETIDLHLGCLQGCWAHHARWLRIKPNIATMHSGVVIPRFGFRVSGFGVRVSGFWFRVSGFGSRVSGFESWVSGFGSRVSGLEE